MIQKNTIAVFVNKILYIIAWKSRIASATIVCILWCNYEL